MVTHLLIHYGEIALKGDNRGDFEAALVKNIEAAIGKRVNREHGRLVIPVNENENNDSLLSRLTKIPGIAWCAPAIECASNIEAITACVISHYTKQGSVKVDASRADKSFPFTSQDVNRHVGKALADAGHQISMKPENVVWIEITRDRAFVFFEKQQGVGGLPVGTQGKVLVLLSGGIDSPVAAYLMAKRGCSCEFLHVHGLSSTEEVKASKIIALVRHLAAFTGPTQLHVVPYDTFHMASLGVDPRHEMILFRRFVFLLAERLAKALDAEAIVTGDNIGQVASQTLANIAAVDQSLSVPVLRPLAGFDKNEIVSLANRIGTYDLSIQSYKDCCSLTARHPSTKTTKETVLRHEQDINMDKIIETSVKHMHTIDIKE